MSLEKLRSSGMCDVFFFQAEDGIRDLTVTGVQTCALPISTIGTEAPDRAETPSRFIRGFETSFPSFERLAEIQDRAKPIENSFALNFGPQLLNVKASYLEKAESAPAIIVDSSQPSLRRYLKLLGSTSFGGTNLSGEGELTYGSGNTVPGDCDCLDWPRMMRLGIKSRWQGLRYGADI